MTPTNFRRLVWAHYKKYGRHKLPWRKTHDVYKILVSEVMLQQTQVERVIPFYKKFIKQFPTAKKLAGASLSTVLRSWQGLGYNRRAKLLREAAKELLGKKRLTVVELEKLSGVGPYTARAVAAFAYNEDVVMFETNIRTVIIEYFFPQCSGIADTEISKVLKQVLPKGKSREWYYALMDFGKRLKRSGVSHNIKIKKHVKQAKFAGSLREARGAILRELSRRNAPPTELVDLLGTERSAQMRSALRALFTERLVKKEGKNYALAD